MMCLKKAKKFWPNKNLCRILIKKGNEDILNILKIEKVMSKFVNFVVIVKFVYRGNSPIYDVIGYERLPE